MIVSPNKIAALTASGQTVVLPCAGYPSAAWVLKGTFSATVTFEASVDGTTWTALNVLASNGTTPASTATATGIYTAAIGGFHAIRARCSAYVSGTVEVEIRASASGGSPIPTGVVVTSIPLPTDAATATNQALQLAQETAAATVLGTTTDAAVGNANGTINAHVRYANSVWASVWDTLNNWLKVSIQNATLAVTQSGTWTVLLGNAKTIKTVTGTVSVDTDIVSAVASKRIKVVAYALFSASTTSNTITFQSNASAALWTVPLQAPTSGVFGANLAVPAPAWIFATAAGEKLTLDVSAAQNVTYSVSYFDDDAT